MKRLTKEERAAERAARKLMSKAQKRAERREKEDTHHAFMRQHNPRLPEQRPLTTKERVDLANP